MLQRPALSIIIPVYNVEKYIFNCLRSISSQTFEDFEALIVDDGSTDNSGYICDEYIKKDPRFKVYHKTNGGVSSARNLGLNNIHGEWIYFCDADDILFNNALETLIKHTNKNVDCTMGGYIRMNEKEEILGENKIDEECYMSIEETLVDFYNPRFNMFNGFIWNRLFRRSIIENYHLRFREDIFIKEDGLFLVQYLCRCCHGTFYTTKPIYKYIEHSSSAMNHKLKKINKESISRLTASLECYKEIKRRKFFNVLPLAKKHVLFVRQQLLITDKSRGMNRLKFRIFVDKMITKVLSPVSILNVYLLKFRLAKR
jgi:glycosyltransferase involved in cell wall biosynthesis